MHHKPHLREVEEEELEDAGKEARVDGYIDNLPASNDLVLQIYGNFLFVLGIIFFILLLVIIPVLIDKLPSPMMPIISTEVIVIMTAIVGARIKRQNTAILPTFILLLIIFATAGWYCIVEKYYLAAAIAAFLVITGIFTAYRLGKSGDN